MIYDQVSEGEENDTQTHCLSHTIQTKAIDSCFHAKIYIHIYICMFIYLSIHNIWISILSIISISTYIIYIIENEDRLRDHNGGNRIEIEWEDFDGEMSM